MAGNQTTSSGGKGGKSLLEKLDSTLRGGGKKGKKTRPNLDRIDPFWTATPGSRASIALPVILLSSPTKDCAEL